MARARQTARDRARTRSQQRGMNICNERFQNSTTSSRPRSLSNSVRSGALPRPFGITREFLFRYRGLATKLVIRRLELSDLPRVFVQDSPFH